MYQSVTSEDAMSEDNGTGAANVQWCVLTIFYPRFFSTVRPRDTRPQAARTSQVHVFELGPKKIEMNEFM